MRRLVPYLFVLFLLVITGLAPSAQAQSTATVTGFVVGTDLRGIPGARVRTTAGPAVGRSVQSAANGAYTLSNLPAGNYTLLASANGFADEQRAVTVSAAASQRVDFTLRTVTGTGGVIEGTVTQRGTSTGVSGARVTASDAFRTFVQTTDSSGFYRFTALSASVYRVEVSRLGYLTQQRSGLTVRDGRTLMANFALSVRGADLARIEGRITTDTGRSLRDAQITLLRDGATVISTRSSSSGAYALSNLVPDTYALRITASGFQSVLTPEFDVAAGVRLRQDFSLITETEPTAVLTGFVRDDFGDAIGGARVEITSGIDQGAFDIADDTGAYSIDGLAPGRRTVTASAGSFNTRNVTVTLLDGETRRQDFNLRGNGTQETGSVTGRVTDQERGLALRGVRVRVSAGPLTGRTTTTDASGDYSVADLPVGTYALNFSRSGYESRTVTDVVVRASATTTANAQLDVASGDGRIFGRVRNGDNEVLEGVAVTLFLDGAEEASAVTDESGDYEITGLAAGTYTALFEAEGYRNLELADLDLRTDASLRVNATLLSEGEETGAVAGLVRDTNGMPVDGATVELRGANGVFSVQTGSNGRFTFGDVPVGAGYRVTAAAPGLVAATANLTVRSGETSETILTMQTAPGAGNIGGSVRSAAGPVLPGAVIRIVSGRRIGETRTASSTGQFSFQGLESGTYAIEASTPGFRPQRRTVIVRGGTSSFVNFFLNR